MERLFTAALFCLLAGSTGCRDLLPSSPSSLDAPSDQSPRLVRTPPPVRGLPPEGASLFAGHRRIRLGPRNAWSGTLDPALELPLLLEIDPLGGEVAYHRLRRLLTSETIWPLNMPLLARSPLPGSVYLELLDLLQEFLRPWSNSRVQRWSQHPQRVELPALPADDPYLVTCREALVVWNQALGETWLEAVEPGSDAPIHCTVFDTDDAAFTRAESRDAAGNPLRLRVHLSRRWAEDHPRYIRRVWVHEFGHALGLWGHSRDLRHVVNGRAVITDAPHADEIATLRLLHRLPRGFDLSWIRRRWSEPKEPVPCPVLSADVDLPGQEILHRAVPGPQRGADPARQRGPARPGRKR